MTPPRSSLWMLLRSLPPAIWVKAAIVLCLLIMGAVVGFFVLLAGVAGLMVAAAVGWLLPSRREAHVPEPARDWRPPDDPPGSPNVIETDYTVIEDRTPRDRR